jgi:hypothetical protein
VGGIALEALSAEDVDGLYRELERHGKAAGKCRTAGVTCKANGCSPENHDGLAPKSVRHVHTMPRKALQDAMLRGYLGRHVCDLANPLPSATHGTPSPGQVVDPRPATHLPRPHRG